MKRRIIAPALWTIVLALCWSAEAQEKPKMIKIGWLGIGSVSSVARYEVFRQALRQLGYVEGKNIIYEYRSADNKLELLPPLAEELVRLKVNLLVTRGTAETLALKNATKTIPIVFYDVTDPVGAGLVDSLSHPGGNITGYSGIEAALAGKRLDLLKELLPKLSRVAVLWNPEDPSSAQQWKASQQSAAAMAVQIHSMEVKSGEQYEGAFKEAAKTRSEALSVIAGSLEDTNRARIVGLAVTHRLPAIYPRTIFVESNGLMSYGRNQDESIKRVPAMIDKILKGTKPADIPVEQPMKFELVINLNAAKQIGLTIPQKVLARADRVIK